MRQNFKERGQAVLIILLVMVVGLTVGLSLATRTVTDIKISQQTEESARAFSAAEAGIEAYLQNSGIGSTGVVGSGSYTITAANAGGNDELLKIGEVTVGDTFTLWLIGHDAATEELDWTPANAYGGSGLAICWATAGNPAVEVTAVYRNGAGPYTYGVSRAAYDPSGIRSNGFALISGTPVGCTGGYYGKQMTFSSDFSPTIPVGATIAALRIRPFYANATLEVKPAASQSLPTQGLNISASGTSGNTTRKVSVLRSYPSLPAIFDYVLFSGTNVSK